MKFDIGDIITLENDFDYFVASKLSHNELKYFLIVKVDEEENLLEEVKICYIDNDGMLVDEDNQSVLEVIGPKLLKSIEDDLAE